MNALAERCRSCGHPPTDKPNCPMCLRIMLDWPDDPEMFLVERGWEQAEYTGNWLEPIIDCTYEVTGEMVAEAQKRLNQAVTYSEFDHVKGNATRRKEAAAVIETAQANLDSIKLMQELGERTDLQSLTDKRFQGTTKHGQVVMESATTLSHRSRNQHRLVQAVRMELNKEKPLEKPRKFSAPRFSNNAMEAMERSYLLKDKGVLKPDSKAKLADRQSERSEVYAEQCVFCRRWPEALEQ